MNVSNEKVLEVLMNSGVSADISDVENDTSLSGAGVDSLDMSNFFLCLEEAFEVKIPDEDLDSLDSIDEIVMYLQSK